MKTAFVTGATGFLGLHLVEHLVGEGVRVVALHRRGADTGALSRLPVELAVGAVDDLMSVERAMPVEVDVVFHLAGNTSTWSGDRALQIRDNVWGTRNVVIAALGRRAKKLVHTSTAAVYGPQPDVPFDEGARPVASAAGYVRSKADAEREIDKGIERGLDATILQPAIVLGRGDRRGFGRVLQLVARGRLRALPDSASSFADARAVARAHLEAARRGGRGERYLLGGHDLTFAEIGERVLGLASASRRRALRSVPVSAMWPLAIGGELAGRLRGKRPSIGVDTIRLLARPTQVRSDKAIAALGYRIPPLDETLREVLG
jgi:nucleoside-diphosphate-sugar epimerase